MTADASRSCLGLATCVGSAIRQIVDARVLLTATVPPALPGRSVLDGSLAPPLGTITRFLRSAWRYCDLPSDGPDEACEFAGDCGGDDIGRLVAAVFTIGHVARILGEDEDWLHDLSIDMFPEDGRGAGRRLRDVAVDEIAIGLPSHCRRRCLNRIRGRAFDIPGFQVRFAAVAVLVYRHSAPDDAEAGAAADDGVFAVGAVKHRRLLTHPANAKAAKPAARIETRIVVFPFFASVI
jgi:hypothetical protein